jgi:hypothetical protein
MRSVFPFGGVVNLRFRETCHQVTWVLSCGSSERRRPPDAVGPYWLGPSSMPLARWFFKRARLRGFPTLGSNEGLQATTRSTSRSSTPLQSITAATSHRIPVPGLSRFGACAGQTSESKQVATAHPATEATPAGGTRYFGPSHCRQARNEEARGTGSLNAFRSQDGSVLGLGPFVASPYGEETVERPASNFVTWLASQLGDACSGSESPFARRRRTGALRGFLLRVPDGSSTASGRQRERRPVAEVTRRLPRAWCLTEVRSGGARHAAGT